MDNQSLLTYNGDEAIVVYQSEDNTLRLDVQMAQETVWLGQQQMAELFNSTIPNISIHIRNIFKERELDKEATVKDFLIVQNEVLPSILSRISNCEHAAFPIKLESISHAYPNTGSR